MRDYREILFVLRTLLRPGSVCDENMGRGDSDGVERAVELRQAARAEPPATPRKQKKSRLMLAILLQRAWEGSNLRPAV